MIRLKHLLLLAIVSILSACSTTKSVLLIPANQSIEIDYPTYDLYDVKLKNKGREELAVAVLSKDKNEQVRGFGLGKKATVDVLVEAENKLSIKNSSNSNISIALIATSKTRKPNIDNRSSVSFTLKNTTAQSIPLIIPTVMNPNLSPFSNSGVDLKIGQEIFFKYKGKRYVLLTVDQSIENGAVLDVAKLIKERRKEIDQ